MLGNKYICNFFLYSAERSLNSVIGTSLSKSLISNTPLAIEYTNRDGMWLIHNSYVMALSAVSVVASRTIK